MRAHNQDQSCRLFRVDTVDCDHAAPKGRFEEEAETDNELPGSSEDTNLVSEKHRDSIGAVTSNHNTHRLGHQMDIHP
jgi:hypothetical protein